MKEQDIQLKFQSFMQTYASLEIDSSWDKVSLKFRNFWKDKIMNNPEAELSEVEMDEIIRILDRNAKGHIKEDLSVAKVMIPQGVWYRLFRELKSNEILRTKLNKILCEQEDNLLISEIDDLYSFNELVRNSLTGKSGNAINTLLFAFNPKKYLSIVSLNDRKRVIDYFHIPNSPIFNINTQGEKIVFSNKSIIEYFKSVLDMNISPRTISDFLYLKLKDEWKNEIPDYQTVMLPILKFASDKKEHHIRELLDYISNLYELDEDERTRRLSSGYDTIINNRVGWARTYLKKAGLLEDPRRGYFRITDKGLSILKQNPPEINVKFLMQFSEFRKFQNVENEEESDFEETSEEEETPDELIARGYKKLNENLYQELLDKLRNGTPEFFEQVVVDLLTKMGYGKGEKIGGPGDGGIDGIIYEDPLRMDKIYVQAKRYSEYNVIGPNEILKFIGVLANKSPSKGVFITTSKFHQNVDAVIASTRTSLALIDGNKLVELMVTYNVGVSVDRNYEIKKIDSDYFEE